MATSDVLVDHGQIPKEVEDPTTATLLEATSVNCHLLAEKLRKQKSQNVNVINSYLGNNLPGPAKDDKSKYLALLADYLQLKSDKQNVDDYNKRLLTYNAQKDEYTSKLIRELKMKPTNSGFDQTIRSGSNDDVTMSREKYVQIYEDLQNKTRENAALKKQVEKSKVDYKEESEVLKMQVRAHRDDWEAERREKVEVENREIQLQEKLHKMERKVQELQQQLLEIENCKCSCRHRNGSYSEPIIQNHLSALSSNSYYGSSARLIPRSSRRHLPYSDCVSDGGAQGESNSGKNSSSSNSSLSSTSVLKSASTTSLAPSVTGNKSTDIQCPDCGKLFPQHVHLHFLEHFERCHRRTLL